MKLLKILPAAQLELTEAALWYESQQPGLSAFFLDSYEQTLDYISQYPKGFERVRHNTRQGIIRHFPYVVMYEEYEDMIVIYAIVHAKQHIAKRFRKRR